MELLILVSLCAKRLRQIKNLESDGPSDWTLERYVIEGRDSVIDGRTNTNLISRSAQLLIHLAVFEKILFSDTLFANYFVVENRTALYRMYAI